MLFLAHKSPLKKLSVIFGLSLLALTNSGALPEPDLILKVYFAGAQKIAADPHSNQFTNEFCSTEALALRAQTANKLSAWLSEWLQMNAGTRVADGASKLRPLFDDLQRSEFLLEIRTETDGRTEAAMAIKLDPARARLWQANLQPFFPIANFESTGGWLIFDSYPPLLNLGNQLARKVSTPPAGWFELDVNWPALELWRPALRKLGLPETQFLVTASDENFRVNGKFFFPENLALNLEPWQIPTNTMHPPFDSFTAVRGFSSWWRSQPWAQPYQSNPAPNQLFVWALPSFPFQTFAAVPVPNAVSAVRHTYEWLAPLFGAANAKGNFLSAITPEITNNEIAFTGMPSIVPHLRALVEPAGQFLFWGTLPNTPRSKPLPSELFKRLETKNLVYYHWEITAQRMPQMLDLGQFGLMITAHKQLESNSVSFKWLQRISGSPGNTDTEITQSGPNELIFTRKGPGIFTAAELFTLANWLETTNFPGCDLRLPPPSPRLQRMRSKNGKTNFHAQTWC